MPRSIIGFHYGVGGIKRGIGAWIENANSKGIPVGLKGVDDAGLCFEGQARGQQHGIANHLIYRVSTAGQNNGIQYDVPDYLKSPKEAAQEHFDKTSAKWPIELNELVVWMEPINEPRGKDTNEPMYDNMHPVNWLGYFMYEYAVIANALGFKVCGPSFNSGEPGDNGQGTADAVKQYSQPGMLKYLAYCAANPNKAALSIHEYTWNLPPPQYPQLWGRYEAAIAAADLNGIPRTFPIFVTEFGFSLNNAPTMPQVEQWLDFYNQRAAYFPQVKMAASWTLQSGYSPVDIQVNTWLTYFIEKVFNEGQQPHKTHEIFGGTLPKDETMNLQQTLWAASSAEYEANRKRNGAVKYPPAGSVLWEPYLKNVMLVCAHNQININYEDKQYSILGWIDPRTQELKEVSYYTFGMPHAGFITEPEKPVNPSPPGL